VETIFWSFVVRFGQAVIEASLTLLIGVVVAGILRRMLTPAGTRRLFRAGWVGLFRGWLAGMLLPVCSLGVIPVAREMRRSGVPGGTVLAFVLAAPLLNPISFLYGLTLAEPKVILCFAGFSLVLSTAAGFLWDRVFARSTDAVESEELARIADAEPKPAEGPRRMLAIAVTAARELTGRDLIFYLIGLVGTALLSALIPFGSLQHTMHHGDAMAPVLMMALAVPIFSSPLPGMMKIGLMFDHGNSIGAAFVLFAIGIGTSLGTIAWLLVDFGWRRTLPWLGSYVVLILAMAYLCEPLLYDTRKAEVDHTHAFDEYSRPFPAGMTDLPEMSMQKIREKFGPLEKPCVYGIAALIGFGLIVRRFDRDGRLERWLTVSRTADGIVAKRPKWDFRIPGPVLGGLSLIGLIVFSVIGAYVYYPDRDTCMEQMFALYADSAVAVKTGKPEEAIRHLEQWDLLIRKLEVGVYLRNLRVSPEQSKTAEDLREAIEEVRDELLDQSQSEFRAEFRADFRAAAKARFAEVDAAYKELKAAYPK
jgi:uncharacterized protein